MNKNREVLKHCPHFYTIVNFEYYSDDLLSAKLISVYEKYIFSANINDLENVSKVEKLDSILYQYINDYYFRNQIKEGMMHAKVRSGENILDQIVNTIISLFDFYQTTKLKKVYVTRWI